MINMDKGTKTELLLNGWTKLSQVDGYRVFLKTFKVEGQDITVYLDDWSVAPISLHAFHIDEIVIDEDWSFVNLNRIFKTDIHDVTALKPVLPAHVYQEVEKGYCDIFSE